MSDRSDGDFVFDELEDQDVTAVWQRAFEARVVHSPQRGAHLASDTQLADDTHLASDTQLAGDAQLADDTHRAADAELCNDAELGDDAELGNDAELGDDAELRDDAELEGHAEFAGEARRLAKGTQVNLPAVSRKTKPRIRTKRTRPRSKTIALKRLTREELRRGALANPPVEGIERPVQRSECKDGPRPCPWVACKHHLYLDINPRTGSIKINFPDLEPWELQQTCALDVADAGALTLEEIGIITNLTRERVRQVEVRGLLTLQSRSRSLR